MMRSGYYVASQVSPPLWGRDLERGVRGIAARRPKAGTPHPTLSHKGRGMKVWGAAFLLGLAATAAVGQTRPADQPPLISTAEAEALAAELSGASAKRTIEAISAHHRMRGSEGYRRAAELIRDRLT